jgi:transcriptional regulator with XRE-family HTH domain
MLAIMDTTKKDTFIWVDWIIKTRTEKGMTQADLARAAKLTRAAISDYEKRLRTKPDVNSLSRISEALGYPADFLPKLAKQFPDAMEADEETEQIIFEASKLNPQDRAEVIAFIRMKQNLRKKK